MIFGFLIFDSGMVLACTVLYYNIDFGYISFCSSGVYIFSRELSYADNT